MLRREKSNRNLRGNFFTQVDKWNATIDQFVGFLDFYSKSYYAQSNASCSALLITDFPSKTVLTIPTAW